jgi:hypothetical protein
MTTTTASPDMTLSGRCAFVTEMLWQFGPVSQIVCDDDSIRFIAHGLAEAVPGVVDAVGADAAKRDEAKAIIRGFVAARSDAASDKAQADRICRAVHRGWMRAMIAKHPRAAQFYTLCDALRRGRATEKQVAFAKRLIAEVEARG